jgi:CTP synthase (UTP-ammonia lyase)
LSKSTISPARSPAHFAPGSRIGSAYGAASALGEYRCSYGFNPDYRGQLEAAGLRFTAWDDDGEVRGAELADHPFFCGVLFQPEGRPCGARSRRSCGPSSGR